mgnify:CR=1 FL=1
MRARLFANFKKKYWSRPSGRTRACEGCAFITQSLPFFCNIFKWPEFRLKSSWEYVQLGLRVCSCFFKTFPVCSSWPGTALLLCLLSESALTGLIAGASGVDIILFCLSTPRRTKWREKLFLALNERICNFVYAYFLCLQLLFDVCMLSILLWSTWTLSLC